jgi:hypothetical protein
MPTDEVRAREVKAFETRNGNTRFVLVDDSGKEYSTFREEIAALLPGVEGKRVRVDYHEQRRGSFSNVYLDGIEVLDEPPAAAGDNADETAWNTAIEAAPYLLKGDAVEREVPAQELFDKLQPFKQLVADDIEDSGEPDE